MFAVIEPLGHHALMLLLLQLALLLIVARLLGELARRVGLPSVVGELLAGVVLGPSLLGAAAPGAFEWLFPAEAEQRHLLEVVSWLGVIMLLVEDRKATPTAEGPAEPPPSLRAMLGLMKGAAFRRVLIAGTLGATGAVLGMLLRRRHLVRPT